MEDFDFDKIFADKMRQADAPDFSEEDWEQRLLPSLDAENRRRWRVLPLWWLSLLTGLLLLSNIGWWWMSRQSEQRTENLQQKMEQMHAQTIVQYDTAWKKVVVYQYDTVYRTVVTRSASDYISQASKVDFAQDHVDSNLADKSGTAVLQPVQTPEAIQIPASIDQGDHAPAIQEANSEDTRAQNPVDAATSADFNKLPLKDEILELPDSQLSLSQNEIAPTAKKRAPRPPFILKPRAFRIGAGGGLLMPQSASLTGNAGYSMGVTGEIAFSDQLALTLEGASCGVTFNGIRYDEGLGLPPHDPPGDDYRLKSFGPDEGLKSIFQLTLGMRYWMHATKKLSPYLGFGYAMQWHSSFELQGLYIKEDSGKKKEFSLEVPSIQVSLVDLNAGLRYHFLRHWYWQTGIAYELKINPNQPGIPRFLGLKSAVLFAF